MLSCLLPYLCAAILGHRVYCHTRASKRAPGTVKAGRSEKGALRSIARALVRAHRHAHAHAHAHVYMCMCMSGAAVLNLKGFEEIRSDSKGFEWCCACGGRDSGKCCACGCRDSGKWAALAAVAHPRCNSAVSVRNRFSCVVAPRRSVKRPWTSSE